MELIRECNNCLYNHDGKCAGSCSLNGKNIPAGKYCCGEWEANIDFISHINTVTPHFLQDKYRKINMSISDLCDQCNAFFNNIELPINIFDAIKYIYGLSIIDIAILADVNYAVVYQAKTKYIPKKRIHQFANLLCISDTDLMKNTTSVFPALQRGKNQLFSQPNIISQLSSIPVWKQNIIDYLCNHYLQSPVHLSKEFARIDNLYWESGFSISEYTDSEKSLIAYIAKRSKNVSRIEYYVDMKGLPHLYISSQI